MEKYILLLSSITYAYTARDILYENGIKCYVERVSAKLRKNGCGYGVKLKENPEVAKALLVENGLKVKDIIIINE